MYSSPILNTSTLNGVGGQRHAPVALPQGKKPGTIIQEAGWVSGPVSMYPENLAPTGTRTPDRLAFSDSLYRQSRQSLPNTQK
jgi:hypothetical protein